ncbi:MAG: alkyldihydroxyacetonephosphate synthase [Solirubrobacteraceae bacterium]|nr:alkyldihydroxyacetonephosphate synthase [Solirubrobacteraceae bacterium]
MSAAGAAPDPRMRWWGWGVDRDAMQLPPSAQALIEGGLGVKSPPAPRVDLDAIEIPEPRIDSQLRERLEEIAGQDGVRDDRLARISHSAGRSYPDLLRLRAGDVAAPDVVVYPASHEQVRAVLDACALSGVAVVPFGGGTSVVGGVEPERGGFAAVVSLDMARMSALLQVDQVSLLARFEPGMTGPEAESALGQQGLTLGHLPQSWEYATIGGFAATRSAGQASTGYGRMDKLVLGLRLAAPAGDIEVRPHPGTAAGPALRELIVGSEGALGVITEVTVAVRPLPEVRQYEGWSFKSFEAGVDAFRELEQAHAAGDVSRLSDEPETQMSLASAGQSGGAAAKLARRWLKLRGHENGCIAILGFEGEADEAMDRANRARMLLRSAGGLRLGKRPGAAWEKQRYRAPYLRDELLDRGVMVETLETATSWSNLLDLHRAVGNALRSTLTERGTPPLVMCHVSHLYPAGASLYFTFIAAQQRGEEMEQWRAAKSAASDAIIAAGGTITHHHAIGIDHAPWMRAEVGDLGIELLRAAKERLDPRGIMNPGKLIL